MAIKGVHFTLKAHNSSAVQLTLIFGLLSSRVRIWEDIEGKLRNEYLKVQSSLQGSYEGLPELSALSPLESRRSAGVSALSPSCSLADASFIKFIA
uniref:Uncharacterized protein n=1 Tax=Oryza sativa subsp. japonica TaxID=39947 RepID=Q6H4M1_ORYSJ|nr:hypothetical protein [Oryza sativa Japonica Group]